MTIENRHPLKGLRVLIGFENSGIVRDAMIRGGAEAISCDLLPSDRPGPHLQCDIREVLHEDWDMAIVHPPCTYTTNSASWCLKDNTGKKMSPGVLYGQARRDAQLDALSLIEILWKSKIKRFCLENPQGCINTRLPFMPRPQVIQPHQFGHDASKQTCLWLRGLKPLQHTKFIPPRLICKQCKGTNAYEIAFGHGCIHCGAEANQLLPRWANQTDSGQNKLAPGADRWKLRSETYPGVADAMKTQWLSL